MRQRYKKKGFKGGLFEFHSSSQAEAHALWVCNCDPNPDWDPIHLNKINNRNTDSPYWVTNWLNYVKNRHWMWINNWWRCRTSAGNLTKAEMRKKKKWLKPEERLSKGE